MKQSYERWMSCGRKQQLTQKAAKRRVDRIGGSCYKCQFCRWWHVTKREQGVPN